MTLQERMAVRALSVRNLSKESPARRREQVMGDSGWRKRSLAEERRDIRNAVSGEDRCYIMHSALNCQ
jgi:hypothetical protein